MVAPSTTLLAERRGSTLVPLRSTRIAWTFSDLSSQDGHELVIRFRAAAKVAESSADRAMVIETFLSDREALTADTVREQLAPAGRSALIPLAQQSTGEAALSSNWSDVLAKALRAAGFACGIEVLPPYEFEIESPSLVRQRQEAASHQRVTEQLQRATETFSQLKTLREQHPDATMSQLLDRVGGSQQGTMLASLLRGYAEQSPPSELLAVSGSNLVRVKPRESSSKPRMIPLNPSAGPLRSIQSVKYEERTQLLIGAQQGVLLVDPVNPAAAVLYRVGESVASPLGFNAAAIADGQLLASHSELGLMRWSLDRPDKAESLMPGVSCKSLLAMENGRFFCIAGAEIVCIEDGKPQKLPPVANEPAVTLLAMTDSVLTVYRTGALSRLALANWRNEPIRDPDTELSAAATIDWFGEPRLLLATATGGIDCVGLSDSLVTQFSSAHRGWKEIAAAADVIVGLGPDRQRAVMWNPWDGSKPFSDVHLSSLTQHRIADVALIEAGSLK